MPAMSLELEVVTKQSPVITKYDGYFSSPREAFSHMLCFLCSKPDLFSGYDMELVADDVGLGGFSQALIARIYGGLRYPVLGTKWTRLEDPTVSVEAYWDIFRTREGAGFLGSKRLKYVVGLVTGYDLKRSGLKIHQLKAAMHMELLVPQYAEVVTQIMSDAVGRKLHLQIKGDNRIDLEYALSRGYSQDRNVKNLFEKVFTPQ